MDIITKLFQFGRADIHVFDGFFAGQHHWMTTSDNENID